MFSKILEALPGLVVGARVFVDAPSEHGHRVRHRQVEFDVVASVVPPTGEIDLGVSTICETGIPSPVVALAGRQFPRALKLVEHDRLLQRLGIGVRPGRARAALCRPGPCRPARPRPLAQPCPASVASAPASAAPLEHQGQRREPSTARIAITGCKPRNCLPPYNQRCPCPGIVQKS
jgi:hypothetical protein